MKCEEIMKIAVIGAGVSGVTFAINRKKKHPEDDVVIFILIK